MLALVGVTLPLDSAREATGLPTALGTSCLAAPRVLILAQRRRRLQECCVHFVSQDRGKPGLQAPGLKGVLSCHFCSSARRISPAVGERVEAGGRPEWVGAEGRDGGLHWVRDAAC